MPAGPFAALARRLAPDYDLRPAWRLGDPGIHADAAEFWRRLDLLPPGISPEERAKELVAVAYKDGQIVGVTTAQIGLLEQVRARTAMLRGAVDPAHRRFHVGRALLLYAWEILEAWAIAHPDEKLAGISGVVEAHELREAQRQPFGPMLGFGVIGFTPDGCQIRLAWFDHFRFD
jgi:GNAT superfamily N-acetyltransferase